MATVYELSESPKVTADKQGSTVQHMYHLQGYGSTGAALSALATAAPAFETVDGVWILGSVSYSIDQVDGVDTYRGTASYKHKSRDNNDQEELESSGDEKISFDFSGETFTRRTVVDGSTQQSFGTNAKDVGDLINVRNDGTVDGVEVGAPVGSFSVTVLISDATVTNSWLKARYEQLYTLNNATFRSLESGDCLLVGMSGQQRDEDDWEITYKFQVRIKETVSDIAGISLGGSTDIEGFQFAWVMNRKQVSSDELVPQPIGTYIADIYKKSDFSQLGVST